MHACKMSLLDELIVLSKDDHPEKRRLLMNRLTDLFEEGGEAHGDRTTILFCDIITRLLKDSDVETRATYSRKVADHASTPREVARSLVFDEIQVASPVLQRSRVLTDDDLVEVTERCGQDHLMSITKRSEISETVTDALVARGAEPVLVSVTKNLGARFSESSFESLTDPSTASADRLEALSFRADMPPKVAQACFQILPDAARARLASLVGQDWEKARDLVVEAQDMAVEASLAGRAKRVEARVLLSEVAAKKMAIDEVILQLTQEDRPLDVALALSTFNRVPESIATAGMMKLDASALVVLCRALNIREDVFHRVLAMNARRLGVRESQFYRAKEQYRGLSVASAEKVLRHMRMRKAG